MAFEVASAYVSLSAKTAALHAGLRQASSAIDQHVRQMDRKAERASKSASRLATWTGRAVGAALGYVVYSAAKFEQQMDQVAAVTGATADEQARLAKQALDLGKSTKFSAREVAAAQGMLARGGLQVAQITGGALAASLDLAAAGQMDLAAAADTTVATLAQFKLGASEAGKVADHLATAANMSAADVGDFAAALENAGGSAATAGMSLTDTVAVLTTLAATGTKGAEAGSNIKSFLANITTPSAQARKMMAALNIQFFDANGNMKDAATVSGMLRRAFRNLNAEQRLSVANTVAGAYGAKTMLALWRATPAEIEATARALQAEGTAAALAERQHDNLAGKFETMMGAVQSAGISLGGLLVPAITDAVVELTAFIDAAASSGTAASIFESVGSAAAGAFHFLGAAARVAGPPVAAVLDVLLAVATSPIGGAMLAAGAAMYVLYNASLAAARGMLSLRAATAAHPMLLLASAAAGLVGWLASGALSGRDFASAQREAASASREATDAINAQAMAAAGLAGSRVAVEQAKLNQEEARAAYNALAGKRGTDEWRAARLRLMQTTVDVRRQEALYQQQSADAVTATEDAVKGLDEKRRKLADAIAGTKVALAWERQFADGSAASKARIDALSGALRVQQAQMAALPGQAKKVAQGAADIQKNMDPAADATGDLSGRLDNLNGKVVDLSGVTGSIATVGAQAGAAAGQVNNVISAIQRLASARANVSGPYNNGGGLGLASGGVVPGTGNRDTVHTILTPGEYVIPKRLVNALGGVGGVESLLGGYPMAAGGPVPNTPLVRKARAALVKARKGGKQQAIRDAERDLRNAIRDERYRLRAEAVGRQRSRLQTAGSRMSDLAMRAFDDQADQRRAAESAVFDRRAADIESGRAALTPAEAQVAQMERARTVRNLDRAVTDARADLRDAYKSKDRKRIAAARQSLADALEDQQLDALRQQADQERAARDAAATAALAQVERDRDDRMRVVDSEIDLTRDALQRGLDGLVDGLGKRGAASKVAIDKIVQMVGGYGVTFENAGARLGSMFADGLRGQIGNVAGIAQMLAAELAKYLRLRSPAEKGPLSDVDSWWQALGPTLAGGARPDDLGRAVTAGISAPRAGAAVQVNVVVEDRTVTGIDPRQAAALARGMEPALRRVLSVGVS